MRDEPMGDLVFVIIVGAVAAAIGVALGIFLIAPRITRAQDRAETHDRAQTDDEEPGDRAD